MKKLCLFLFSVAAPLAAASAQPETTTEAAPAAATETGSQAAPAADSGNRPAAAERRICRRVDTTGSRTGGQRVCLTAEQWRRVDM